MITKAKQGVILLAGGQPETKDSAVRTALTIMRYFNVHRPSVRVVASLDTNNVAAGADEEALAQCRKAAEMLNQRYREDV